MEEVVVKSEAKTRAKAKDVHAAEEAAVAEANCRYAWQIRSLRYTPNESD